MLPIKKEAKRDREEEEAHLLRCPICIELVVDASQVTCCGALFCKACIDPITAKRLPLCPMCRAPCSPDKVFPDVRGERASRNFPRPCRHAAYGCAFIGPRNDVAVHEPSCQHVPHTELVKEISDLKKQNAALDAKLKAQTAEVLTLKMLLNALLESTNRARGVCGCCRVLPN